MSKEERRLANKIRTFEDMILRSKNMHEIETIRKELNLLRVKLQKMQYKMDRA